MSDPEIIVEEPVKYGILINTQARPFTGPIIQGHAKAPVWSPGPNKVDLRYWETASTRNTTVKRWIKLRWIKLSRQEPTENSDPAPDIDQLMEMQVAELERALDDKETPKHWLPVIRRAIERKMAKMVPIEPDPHEEKSLREVDEAKALEYVANETDLGMLAFWRGEEDEAGNRPAVIEAIDKRLAQLADR